MGGGGSTNQSEALLRLSQRRVGSEPDAFIKVPHGLVHLVQQDLQLRANGEGKRTRQRNAFIRNTKSSWRQCGGGGVRTCPRW